MVVLKWKGIYVEIVTDIAFLNRAREALNCRPLYSQTCSKEQLYKMTKSVQWIQRQNWVKPRNSSRHVSRDTESETICL